ncbi:MAG TPA: SgcJ/EcaC family oxidoreductase [Bacteroidales bacterium]|nr:SgcJ/EcaC family oxidoreductase [Bacteroidales bacterium]
MKKLVGIVGLLFLGVTAFAQQASMSRADVAADEMAVKEISKNWLNMERSHDMDGILQIFADDAVVYTRNSEPLKGKEAIRQNYLEERQKNPNMEVDWTTERVDVASSGDMAVEYGKFTVKNSGPDGKGSDEGNFVTVYKKIDGKWKVVSDIGSSTKPLDEPMQ